MRAWQPESFKQQLLLATSQHMQQALQQYNSSTIQNPNTPAGFKLQELPVVLLSLTQLQVVLPTLFLQEFESLLLPQLQLLSPGQLCQCVFALGAARHRPSSAFAVGVTRQLSAVVQQCQGLDVAHAMYGLAAMDGCRQQLQEYQQQQQQHLSAASNHLGVLQLLLDRADQVGVGCAACGGYQPGDGGAGWVTRAAHLRLPCQARQSTRGLPQPRLNNNFSTITASQQPLGLMAVLFKAATFVQT
jgi:hypothetical protein